jgi:hypothetical protein
MYPSSFQFLFFCLHCWSHFRIKGMGLQIEAIYLDTAIAIEEGELFSTYFPLLGKKNGSLGEFSLMLTSTKLVTYPLQNESLAGEWHEGI